MTRFCITDGVLSEIAHRIGGAAPERGGALLAIAGMAHLLVEDAGGRYSTDSWTISGQLSSAVGSLERAGHGTLVGTVHSHVAGLPDPSATDLVVTEQALAVNKHLDELWVAVLSEGPPRAEDVPVGPRHRLSVHVVRRGRTGATRVTPRIVTLAADLAGCGVRLPSAVAADRVPAAVPEGLPTLATVGGLERLRIGTGVDDGALLVDCGYPLVGPLVLLAGAGGAGLATSPWDPAEPPRPQLAALVAAAKCRPARGFTARTAALTGRLADTHVLVAGVGSVGSRICDDLVRCGVGRLTLVDPGSVEVPNLARSVYTLADVDSPKPVALARRLLAVGSALEVRAMVEPVGRLDLATVLADVDLVIGATDEVVDQNTLIHHAYAADIPAVGCALYRAAAAGEVVLVSPTHDTACWRCAIGGIEPGDRPEPDYGLGSSLVGEPALWPSIQLVANVAATAAIGLLASSDTPAGAAVARLLGESRTLGLVATSPGWGPFAGMFAGMPHQHAPQSLWAVVRPQVRCPICGPVRLPPPTHEDGDDLRALLADLRAERSGSG